MSERPTTESEMDAVTRVLPSLTAWMVELAEERDSLTERLSRAEAERDAITEVNVRLAREVIASLPPVADERTEG